MKFALLIAVLFPISSWACSGLRVVGLRKTVEFVENSSISQKFDVVADSSTACHFFVTFGRGTALAGEARRLVMGAEPWPFNLYKDAARTKILEDGDETVGGDHVLEGDFEKGAGLSRKTLTYRAILSPMTERKPGLYEEDIVMSIYEGTPGAAQLRSTETLRFRATARTSLSATLHGTDLSIVSNADYDVSLSADGAERNRAERKFTVNGEQKTISAAPEDVVTITIQSRE